MDDKYTHILKEAKRVLLKNYEATGRRYITPAWPHYKYQWLWDSSFHAIASAELGMPDLAKNEIRGLLKYQEESGFIPHTIFHGERRFYDLERFFYKDEHKKTHSSIVGPPVLAQAVLAINDTAFWREVAEGLTRFYRYFEVQRMPLRNGLISILHPRESRDSSPEFDFFRPRAPFFAKWLDRFLDPIFILRLERQYQKLRWNEQRIFKASIFHVQDLMVHAIWVEGLIALKKILETIGSPDLYPGLAELILRSQKAVLENCWDEKEKTFYSLRAEESHGMFKVSMLKTLSIGSLFPLVAGGLSPDMKESIVKKIRDEKEFGTLYPLPSVGVGEKNFNPAATWPLWRGPAWINTNWFLIRALAREGFPEEARHIAEKSLEMVGREGFYEFYNPLTGKGLRVKDFGWSTLAVTFFRYLS